MTRGWGRVQDPGADRRRPRELANRATMGALRLRAAHRHSGAAAPPGASGRLDRWERGTCCGRRTGTPAQPQHGRAPDALQTEGRVSVQIHPMSSLVGLSCLAALSLQGGPDGPTYSGTTPRQRLFSSPPSRPQLRRRYRVKAVRRDEPPWLPRRSRTAGSRLPLLSKTSGLELASDESDALSGEGAVTVDALVRLLSQRQAAGPQAAQRVKAVVVDDLELAAGLDEYV